MRVINIVHLDRGDKIKGVGVSNNFGKLQYHITFEGGESILIDEDALKEIDKYRPRKEKT